MVEVYGVRELVYQHVAYQRLRQEQQLGVQADVAPIGATAPACALQAQGEPVIGQRQTCAELFQARFEGGMGASLEPFPQCAAGAG